MDSVSPPKPANTQQLAVWRADFDGQKAADKKPAPEKIEAPQAPPLADLQPPKLRIEIDAASGRFISSLVDSSTQEILARYPTERQLAFSRAVAAYLKAMRER